MKGRQREIGSEGVKEGQRQKVCNLTFFRLINTSVCLGAIEQSLHCFACVLHSGCLIGLAWLQVAALKSLVGAFLSGPNANTT